MACLTGMLRQIRWQDATGWAQRCCAPTRNDNDGGLKPGPTKRAASDKWLHKRTGPFGPAQDKPKQATSWQLPRILGREARGGVRVFDQKAKTQLARAATPML